MRNTPSFVRSLVRSRNPSFNHLIFVNASPSSAPDSSSSSATPLPRHGAQVLKRQIAPGDREVIKRDGSRVRYDQNKITRAVALAFREVHAEDQDNPYRDDMLDMWL